MIKEISYTKVVATESDVSTPIIQMRDVWRNFLHDVIGYTVFLNKVIPYAQRWTFTNKMGAEQYMVANVNSAGHMRKIVLCADAIDVFIEMTNEHIRDRNLYSHNYKRKLLATKHQTEMKNSKKINLNSSVDYLDSETLAIVFGKNPDFIKSKLISLCGVTILLKNDGVVKVVVNKNGKLVLDKRFLIRFATANDLKINPEYAAQLGLNAPTPKAPNKKNLSEEMMAHKLFLQHVKSK